MARDGRSAWWSRARGIPTAAYDAWTDSMGAHPGWPRRILAWAPTVDGFCLGSPAALSWSRGTEWRHVAWHRIEHGGWNAELRQLNWVLVAAPGDRSERGSVALAEPGRLPELFRERVAATIVVQRFVPLAAGPGATSGATGVTVTGRRDLTSGELSWHASLTRGVSWQTDGVRAAADRALADLRAEFQ